MKFLLQNGTVFVGEFLKAEKYDIFLEKGRIQDLGPSLSTNNFAQEEIIDCTDMEIFPGFFDLHVHFRQPGQIESEDIASGLEAAARGGFTSVAAMANTKPTVDSKETLRENLDRAEALGGVKYYQIAAVSKDLAGKELNDIEGLLKEGAIAFSDDGRPLPLELLEEILHMSADLSFTVIEHCEELDIPTEDPMSEVKAIDRNLNLLSKLGKGKLHLAHISCRESMELIIAAKKDDLSVSCEVCPHHLSLTKDALKQMGSLAKMNPPLREKKDLDFIQEAILSGWVDALATDHAPHFNKNRETALSKAPYGIIGLETAIGVVWQHLYNDLGADPALLGRLFSTNPHLILGRKAQRIEKGEKADLTVIAPQAEWLFTADSIASKSKNSPYLGKKFKGQVFMTIKDGEILYAR